MISKQDGIPNRTLCVVDFLMNPLPEIDISNLTLPNMPEPPAYKAVDLRSVFLPTRDLYPELNGERGSEESSRGGEEEILKGKEGGRAQR